MSIGLIDNNVATKGSASTPKSTRAEFSKEMDGFEAKLKDRLEKGGESNAYDEMGNKFRNRCALNYYNLIQCSLSTPDILPFYGIYGNPIIPIDANGTIEEVRMKTLTQLLCKFDIKSQFKN